MRNKKSIKNPMATTWMEDGILHSLDNAGRNIVFNDHIHQWVRVDEIIWNYFGNEDLNGREIIHVDGNVRNDAIDNLRLVNK